MKLQLGYHLLQEALLALPGKMTLLPVFLQGAALPASPPYSSPQGLHSVMHGATERC